MLTMVFVAFLSYNIAAMVIISAYISYISWYDVIKKVAAVGNKCRIIAIIVIGCNKLLLSEKKVLRIFG